MRNELEKILRSEFYVNEHDDCDDSCSKKYYADEAFERAVTSIINLVDKEVIKDDEDLDVQSEFDKLDIPHPETDKYPYLYSVRQASRNILKAKQRAIIRGNDE